MKVIGGGLGKDGTKWWTRKPSASDPVKKPSRPSDVSASAPASPEAQASTNAGPQGTGDSQNPARTASTTNAAGGASPKADAKADAKADTTTNANAGAGGAKAGAGSKPDPSTNAGKGEGKGEGSGTRPPPSLKDTLLGRYEQQRVRLVVPLILAVTGSFAVGLSMTYLDDTPEFIMDLPARGKEAASRTGGWTPAEEAFAEALARHCDANDTVKELAASCLGLSRRLLTLAAIPASNPRAAACAVRAVECMARSEDCALLLGLQGVPEMLVGLLENRALPAQVHVAAAAALAAMSRAPDTVPRLVRVGAIQALHEHTERHGTKVAVRRALQNLCAEAEGGDYELAAAAEVVARYAAEQRANRDSVLFKVYDPLLESGIMMYVNTMLGGGAWGLAVALANKQPRAAVLRSVMRTAVVTGVVPLYFVGAAVTAFNAQRRRVDSPEDLIVLYGLGTFSLFPWYYLLPIVEAWAPLWLGGHVLGFMFFGGYLMFTGSELLARPPPAERPGSKKAIAN